MKITHNANGSVTATLEPADCDIAAFEARDRAANPVHWALHDKMTGGPEARPRRFLLRLKAWITS